MFAESKIGVLPECVRYFVHGFCDVWLESRPYIEQSKHSIIREEPTEGEHSGIRAQIDLVPNVTIGMTVRETYRPVRKVRHEGLTSGTLAVIGLQIPFPLSQSHMFHDCL